MMIVGLTGGIGSGKTAVAERFAAFGTPVVDADVASRTVVAPGQPALAKLVARYGADTLTAQGVLDRSRLRARVFADDDERLWLEALLHPLIMSEIRTQINALRRSGRHPYALLCSPLLFETQQHAAARRVLVVDVPEKTQIARVAQRDRVSAEAVVAIQRTQLSRWARLQRADDILDNSAGIAALSRQVDALHARYLSMSAD